jgi:hypothetical protein
MNEQLFALLCLLPVAALANWQVVETLHHGSIFEKTRAYCEVRGGFCCEIWLCPFCQSHWTALLMSLLVSQYVLQRELNWAEWCFLPVYVFAVTRLSNWLNDYFHESCRTPRLKLDDINQALKDIAKEPDDPDRPQ